MHKFYSDEKRVEIIEFMDLRIGFWNIKEKNLSSYIYDLLISQDLDLLFLSEHHEFLANLSAKDLPKTYEIMRPGPLCQKVMAIKKVNLDFFVCTDGKRYIALKSNSLQTTIVALHLTDNTNDGKAYFKRYEELKMVLEASHSINNAKEIFVGDFNCMPYADELTSIEGMHAVLFKKEVESRKTKKKKRYNPMLLHLNEQDETYGSFRYASGECPLYWYAYDQVIVSEPLVDLITDIEYLKYVNKRPLMSSKGINPSVSDHLPLTFRIKEISNG